MTPAELEALATTLREEGSKPTQRGRTPVAGKARGQGKAREKELHDALAAAVMALWNVQGVLDLVRETGQLDKQGFPPAVAACIRIMSYQVDDTVGQVETVL